MPNLTHQQKDALKEIENLGAGKASSQLSKLLGKEVKISTPLIHLSPLRELENLISGPSEQVVGMYSNLSGDMTGTVLLVLSAKCAMDLTNLLQQKTEQTTHLTKVDLKQLEKLGSLLSKTYLTSMASFLKLNVKTSNSKVLSTFGESLADVVLIGIKEKNGLYIKSDFSIKGTKINGDFILLLGVNSTTNLLKAIKM